MDALNELGVTTVRGKPIDLNFVSGILHNRKYIGEYCFRKMDATTLEGGRKLIDSFVNSVVVYDDYVLITFNYKDGTKTLSFKDIEISDLSSFGGRNTGIQFIPSMDVTKIEEAP